MNTGWLYRPSHLAPGTVHSFGYAGGSDAQARLDLRVYKTYWREAEQAMTLQPGQAYVIGPDDSRGVYRVRRRYSPPIRANPRA
jgi:hypothetical protein